VGGPRSEALQHHLPDALGRCGLRWRRASCGAAPHASRALRVAAAIAARPLTREPLRPLRAAARAGQGPARRARGATEGGVGGHDQGFGAETGESEPVAESAGPCLGASSAIKARWSLVDLRPRPLALDRRRDLRISGAHGRCRNHGHPTLRIMVAELRAMGGSIWQHAHLPRERAEAPITRAERAGDRRSRAPTVVRERVARSRRRRPELRHHDPQYRASVVAATATCSRYRQVTAAIKGLWSRSEIN
jgi:hypothetical protein